jgi:hypothetical protein
MLSESMDSEDDNHVPQTIVQGAMDVLAHKITASSRLNNAVVWDSIGHISKHFAFILGRLVKDDSSSVELTEQPFDMFLKVELRIWLHHHSRYDKTVLVARPYGFHETCRAQRLFILQVS